uniref:Uncharacterized protein n=1 Tax=Siphoviridae sp. ctXzK3 TaxID=2827889 RepID=A0A8S5SVP5_9CAUD|nr:MAG TPA: hypothetical protein [Siphoviridae sp. ctXzK3]
MPFSSFGAMEEFDICTRTRQRPVRRLYHKR